MKYSCLYKLSFTFQKVNKLLVWITDTKTRMATKNRQGFTLARR